jgi:hypothetical protein
MFYVADVRGKADLSIAISLGFSVEDFSELKRDFIGFDYERG